MMQASARNARLSSRQADWLKRQCEKRHNCTVTQLAIKDGAAFERLCREYRERKPLLHRLMDLFLGTQVA